MVIHSVLELELEGKACVLEELDMDELNICVLELEDDGATCVDELSLSELEDEDPIAGRGLGNI